ncbi:uncharacterized protein LOC143878292 [Tasmannia lanceolata]|uniref:uncharacterized protein LOC143878292 n=1 Tax=Tasmannia lanceolata TaxID=3420 RepID=UPI0040643280
MVYTYTPIYYSSLHDTITSLCKNILPFSLKKKRLPGLSADQKLAKLQSENLKWQQDSFHQILNLIGLHKEGIVQENEVAVFRSHLLDTLIASPIEQEQPQIIRDKLLFLQELFYAKCISVDEYHSSKRPLLQRLAVQGVEIDCRDVIVGGPTNQEEEWSVIELKDEQCLISKSTTPSKTKDKHRSPMKQIKGAVSMINVTSPYKSGKSKGNKGIPIFASEPLCPVDQNRPYYSITNTSESFKENPFWENPPNGKGRVDENQSILMPESSPPKPTKIGSEKGTDKVKKKVFGTLFQREQSGENRGNLVCDPDEVGKSAKKRLNFDGFKKWKKSKWEDESTMPYLPTGERSDDVSSTPCVLVASPIGEGPNTKRIKKKIHSDGSASDFFIDKVLGDNIKKELSRIQKELCTTNPNLCFSNEQMETISTRLPVDKADLKMFFPKSWCDRYGDIVLDVVRKEFKDHVGEMESLQNAGRGKQGNSARWVAFDDDNNDENCHPNLFSHCQVSSKQETPQGDGFYCSSNSKCFSNNPFYEDKSGGKLRSESTFFDDSNQNPFWTPRGSSKRG